MSEEMSVTVAACSKTLTGNTSDPRPTTTAGALLEAVSSNYIAIDGQVVEDLGERNCDDGALPSPGYEFR